jgi:hypothetical protein
LIAPVLRLTLLISPSALVLAILAGGQGAISVDTTPVWLRVTGLLFAPVLQTVLLRFCLHWLGKVVPGPMLLSLGAAALFGLLYGRANMQTLALIWAYYPFGAVFLRLQVRSLHRAYGVVILLHALHYLILWFGLLLG